MKALISDAPSDVGSDARTIVTALFERPWRIVHIAGHGALLDNGMSGGVALSNGAFLGPAEIRNMRAVPELVFVNCCHLASGDAEQLLNPRYDRASFASGIPVMPTLHPSYLLRPNGAAAKPLVWQDMLTVLERLGVTVSEKQRGYFRNAS